MSEQKQGFTSRGFWLWMLLILMGVFLILTETRNVRAAETGFVTKSGKTYYVKQDGSYYKGFLKYNGQTYFFDRTTGVMLKGWQYDSKGQKIRFFHTRTGVMFQGYCQNTQGKMRYFAEDTGRLVRGFATDSKGRVQFFESKEGYRLLGWQISGQKVRYFNSKTGYMQTGWTGTGLNKRYFNEVRPQSGMGDYGVMYTGLKKVGSTYYLFKEGYTWQQLKDGAGTLTASGDSPTYVAKYKAYYYFDKDGKLVVSGNEPTKIGDYYYYFQKNGKMLADSSKVIKLGIYHYCFGEDGRAVVSGKQLTKIGDDYYYFFSNGRARRLSWQALNGNRYYFDGEGRAYRNTTKVISGTTYKFDDKGVATAEAYIIENGLVKVVENGRIYQLYPAYLNIEGIADKTVSDETILAAIADREAGNQGLYGMIGVCMVILNRSLPENVSFPNDFRQVIFQYSWQFNEDAQGNFTKFQQRLEGKGWANEATARQAAKNALVIFNKYKATKTARKVPGYKTEDFSYLFFMTPSSFASSGARPKKYETYLGHTFFDTWS